MTYYSPIAAVTQECSAARQHWPGADIRSNRSFPAAGSFAIEDNLFHVYCPITMPSPSAPLQQVEALDTLNLTLLALPCAIRAKSSRCELCPITPTRTPPTAKPMSPRLGWHSTLGDYANRKARIVDGEVNTDSIPHNWQHSFGSAQPASQIGKHSPLTTLPMHHPT